MTKWVMSHNSQTLNGLTTHEKKNGALVDEYREHYVNRRDQCRARIPQQISSEYKKTLQMRHQMLRDLSESCESQVSNRGFEWTHVPLFIKECEKKKFEFDCELLMMELGFPFLAALSPLGTHDI